MTYSVGDVIVSKKNHACGGNEWLVARVGADIKLKCKKCGRAVFLSVSETEKITKTHKKVEDGQN
jgi:hypothetical protein